MYGRTLGAFIRYTVGFILIGILSFFGIRFSHINGFQMIDCATVLLTLWWLFTITTVPWNVHFEAKSVLDEFDLSRALNIAIDEKHEKYVRKISNYSLLIAISLHVASAAALYALAFAGISKIGYPASVVALLLTLLRPAVRGYEYICQQLKLIKERVKYPREDVVDLRNRTKVLESAVKALEKNLNEKEPGTFAYQTERSIKDLYYKSDRLVSEQARISDQNQQEHQVLLREGQEAIARISKDTQFLDHVREVVRLIKSA